MKNIVESFTGIFGKIALAIMFVTALFAGSILAPSVAGACGPTHNDAIAVCQGYEDEGKTVVMFDDQEKLTSSPEHPSSSVSANIMAGVYSVTLVSFDGYYGRSTHPSQLEEEWYAVLNNGGGEIVQTGTIGDLADDVDFVMDWEEVNTKLIVSSDDVTYVVAHHAAYPTGTTTEYANDVFPVCAVFDPEPITIVATKIVCDDESYLPNWGAPQIPVGGINEDTVSNFLDEVNATDNHCSIAQDWQFQWAPQGIADPEDNTGEISEWNTFGNSIQIDFSTIENDNHVWVREVWKTHDIWNNEYVPFTGANTTESYSAEMYCHIDTINYDNFDRVDGIQAGGIYYCVGFNALVEEVNTPPVITVDPAAITITVGDSFDPTDYATADDAEDGDITGDIVVSGDTVDTNTVGTYYVVYDVVDSDDEPAETKTLEVIVEDQAPNLCRVDLDVVIVMDRSGSMSPTFPPLYEDRIGDAKIAANHFVGKLGSDDQSGLVSFASEATLDKELSDDHFVTQSIIDTLVADGATNIGDGIGLANDEFSTSSQVLKIEILLTDGRATYPYGHGGVEDPEDIQHAIDAANAAAQKGIKIFTIGLGGDVNETMLQDIANITGGAYYYATSSEVLDKIFNDIAWDVCHGSISGCKYETDIEGNNISLISGWEMVLSGDTNITQDTDENGCYKFSGLTAGNYTVSEATDQGVDYIQTYPQCPSSYDVTLDDEENVAGYDFGNYLPTCGNGVCDSSYGEDCSTCPADCGECGPICSISGRKYNNIPEENIEGWTIGVAQVANCVTGDEWADSVVDYIQGTGVKPEDQVPVGEYRGDPNKALGAAEDNDTYNFVSLGMGGELILEFDNLILNGIGNDIKVIETSFGNVNCQDYPERADVYASQDGVVWHLLGDVCLDGEVDLTDAGLDWAKYVKLVDVTDPNEFPNDYNNGDGYEVDGIKVLHCGIYETIETTETNEYGYCFQNLDAGGYVVFEEMQINWHIVGVTVGNVPVDYHVDSFFDVFVEVEVENGTTTVVDFWNQLTPVNHPPIIELAYDTLMLILGDIFDPFDGHATTSDVDGDNVTLYADSYVPVDGSNVTTATGTYDVIYTAEDEHGANADPKTLTVIVSPAEVPPICENVVVVSNTDDMIVGGGNAVETWDEHTAWTAVIDLATWIWESYTVQNPAASEIVNFSKDFEIIGTAATATLDVAADNTYKVRINGIGVATSTDENNFQLETQDEYDVSGMLHSGTNTISFEVMNIGVDGSNKWSNPAGLLYRLEIEIEGDSCLNTPPVILGADDPLMFYIGDIETELELEALAQLGVTATDTEDGDITGDITITNLGSVSTSTVGTTTIYYDVVDSWSYPAETVEREVIVEEEPVEENNAPVITLIATTTTITVGDDFDPYDGYATADDVEDGDITGDITASSSVSTTTPGTYYVDYDVDDSEGEPAETKTLEVIVEEEPVYQCSDGIDNDGDGLVDYPNDPGCDSANDNDEYNTYCGDGVCNGSETCSTCSQDCGACTTGGGGGGGGWIPTTIIISHEDVDYLGDGNAMVTWNTNIPATSQVVYGDDSISRGSLGSVPEYGYDSVNDESFSMRSSHSMLITGLTHGTQYYFRPVSDKSGITEVIGKEVTYTFAQPTIPVPPVCNYLLKYIKLGANNNPVEVEKLEKFLNEFENENLPVNGIYEQADYEAVKRFQIKYREDILDPWNHNEATGYVYITTKKKINELYCEREFPLTVAQETEVAAFSTLIGGLQDADSVFGDTGILDVGSIVGVADGDSGILADTTGTETSDETEGPGLLANILGALGFGDDEEEDETDILADGTKVDDASEEDSRNLASTIYSGVMDMATSFWFILLLIVIAIILFFRIRGAEGKE